MNPEPKPGKIRQEAVRAAAKILETTPAIADAVLIEASGFDYNPRRQTELNNPDLERVARKWGVKVDKLQFLGKSLGGDFSQFRRVLANQGYILQSVLKEELMERLSDPERLAQMKDLDLAKILEYVSRSTMVSQEGNSPITINVGDHAASIKMAQDVKSHLSSLKNGSGSNS